MKKITVIIDENGDTAIDLSGFHGKGCDKVMADFSGGEKPTVTRHKAEYREQEKQKEVNRG